MKRRTSIIRIILSSLLIILGIAEIVTGIMYFTIPAPVSIVLAVLLIVLGTKTIYGEKRK